MKQLRHLALTVLVALVGSLSANAHDFEAVNEGSTIYYTITSSDDLTCAVSFRGSRYDSYLDEYSGSVVIPSSVEYNGKTYSVTSIGFGAFLGCSSLTSINIPNSVTSIGDYAFYNCSGLTSINIPNSVTSIDSWAFSGCSGLISITIPNSVTSISYRTFEGCSGLTSITIPNSVTSIDGYAFSYCRGLKEITSMAVTPPSIYYNTFEGVSKTEAVVKVPTESVDAYKTADCWKDFMNIVGQEICAAPEIVIVAGKVVAASATSGAKCHTTISSEDFQEYDGDGAIELSGVYKITSYAHAEGYQNSETVTKLLYWSKPSLDGEAEMTLVGDLNGDGKVNIADLNLVIDIMSER